MRWVTLGVLGGAAAILLAAWDRVPDRWVIHWGGADRPNGWMGKSVAGAMSMLLVGAAVWLLVEGSVWAMRRNAESRQPPLHPAFVDVQAGVARAAALGVALVCGGLTLVLPLVQPRSSWPLVLGAFATIAACLAGSSVWGRAQAHKARAAGAALPRGYENLLYYSNIDDPRVWVPKVSGTGWTLNFAHRRAWAWMLLLAGVPIALVVAIGIATAVR